MAKETCELCGEPSEEKYCSDGCRHVDEDLGEVEEEKSAEAETDSVTSGTDGSMSTLFLRIEGMHSVSSEEYVRSKAESTPGIEEATASYVTGTAKMLYDEDDISEEEIRDRLTSAIVGHTAYLREDEGGEQKDGDASKDVLGSGTRRDEPMMEIKHAVGIVIGAFLLFPYMALVYPGYVASFLGMDTGYSLSAADGAVLIRFYMPLTGVMLYFTGLPLLRGAYTSLAIRKPNTDLLVSLTIVSSYLYGTVAALTGRGDVYYDLTIIVTSAVVTAIFYEASVKEKAVDMLAEVTSSQMEEARLYRDGDPVEVNTEELEPGDRLLVREGERVPVGGTVKKGSCTADESVVTGESLPVSKEEGDEMVAGSTVKSGFAVVRVNEEASGGIKDITRKVWEVQSAEHGIKRRVNDIAPLAFATVMALAVLAGGVYFAAGGTLAESVLASLTVLLVATPWGIGLAAPLSSASGIRESMRNGIVVFDETVFERLRGVETVVFDKTGTLTTGDMRVTDSYGSDSLMEAASYLESFASHPAADAIAEEFASDTKEAEDVETYTTGVSGEVDGEGILVGNLELFNEKGWTVSEDIHDRVRDIREAGGLPVTVGRQGKAEGVIAVNDQPKDGWKETVSELSDRGIKTVILTGDTEEASKRFSSNEEVDISFARVPPNGKREAVRRLGRDGEVAMVGDGTNDALPLAEADFSISMGDGTPLASDAADLAVTDNDIRQVERAFEISETAGRRYRQNMLLSFVYNLAAVPLAVLGLLNPLFVMLATLAMTALLLANSTRGFV
jgi:heavy metal translocating P-type ATPase